MANEKQAVRKAKRGKPIRQVAAVPFRLRDGRPEVLLVTSRGTRRFIVPKGWPMKGKSGRQAAIIEAYEEAGVTGKTHRQPLGKYRYWKRLSDAFVPVEVTVYVLVVDGMLPDWNEAETRERAWLAPADAATLIDEPELASLIGGLASLPQAED
jgi:8-oxo-dGTP pyrophosphatase MutT (NUDIX family)